jgi:arginyl-tRNA synthetase
MKAFKEKIAAQLHSALKKFAAEKGLDADIAEDQIAIETPPKPELGDLAFPMFPFARILRMGPPMIATELARILSDAGVQASAAGPYVNVKFDRAKLAGATVSLMLEQGEAYGRGDSLNGEKIMIEFSSPNTNKPLHLGHLRNNALGESVARILAANGADVKKVNLVNDRGVHICRSMLAYQEQGGGVTPESLGRKSDHFVGDFYVKYNEMASADPSVEQRAQAMLAKWEEGDPKTIELWEKMNRWALDGIGETYGAPAYISTKCITSIRPTSSERKMCWRVWIRASSIAMKRARSGSTWKISSWIKKYCSGRTAPAYI